MTFVEPVDPSVLASDQIIAAVTHLDRSPDSLVHWPFPALDALTGPMGEGEVWFVPAFSGGGKTTFIVSCIDLWRRQGKRIFVMPLELQPYRFRTMLACMEIGTNPGDALSGMLRADPSRAQERERLKAAVHDQMKYDRQLMISEQRAINIAGLKLGLQQATEFEADIVIVDHIDHVSGSDFGSSKEVNHAALKMAQDYGLLLVFTSQLNMEISKADRLAKYAAPMPHHVMFPSTKLQVGTGMIGLFRPLRSVRPGESIESFKAAMLDARKGDADSPDALEPNTMGIVAMKLRNYGSREGMRIALGVERGRVVHVSERDRYGTTYDDQRRY